MKLARTSLVALVISIAGLTSSIDQANAAERKFRIPHPVKELVRPKCAGDDCLAGDYKEHQRLKKKQEKERKKQEQREAKQRQREACDKLKGSGTAHTTRQC